MGHKWQYLAQPYPLASSGGIHERERISLIPLRFTAFAFATCTAASLTLTACGSNEELTSSSSATSSSAGATANEPAKATITVEADPALVAKVPEAVKSKGTLVSGTDSSYAPNEYLDSDGKTIVGLNVDLMNAAAQKLGLKVDYQAATFDSIIIGVKSDKYDIGVSSFTINADRMKEVNMVSYFSSGTQWATAKDNPKNVNPSMPCGLNIAVQTGTTQQEDDLPAKVKACEEAGTPLTVLPYDRQDQATAALVSGKADAMLADSPITAYAVKQAGDKIETVGDIYDAAPYGILVPKDDAELAEAIRAAFESLKTDGTYEQILDNWGSVQGAVTTFEVNPSVDG